ncbi:SH3 domain-binding protein 5-like [Geospiza fortis]|uniref:SH3 domain-binding protein 5 n=1 Tax=Geospiza fortis TaxID=48883 RepID=A0A8N5F668_GEOFO|nr:SH3 domain-binding protein 5-like [Geospiza fortis]
MAAPTKPFPLLFLAVFQPKPGSNRARRLRRHRFHPRVRFELPGTEREAEIRREEGAAMLLQEELEHLNEANAEINRGELELDAARSRYRRILSDSARKLNSQGSQLGTCIERARPYYEARRRAKEAQQETQRAALRYERAVGMHNAAREMVFVAEQGMGTGKNRLDPTWQEMLNHATRKVNEAEQERLWSEREHQRVTRLCQEAEAEVQRLQKSLARNIARSQPCLELKAQFNLRLEEHKSRVTSLEAAVAQAKLRYSVALRNLEQISEEIHARRFQRILRKKTVRENPLGAEGGAGNPEIPGIPRENHGIPGETHGIRSGNPKIPAEVPGEIPGIPRENHRIPGEVSGIPGENRGIPRETPEVPRIPGEIHGIPGEIPRGIPGIPRENHRIPGEISGIPGENHEIPGIPGEIPGEISGIPRENPEIPGFPGENLGIPRGNLGIPNEISAGTGRIPRENPGIPRENPRNSIEHPGNSSENPGNSSENPGNFSSVPSGTFRIPGILSETPGIPRENLGIPIRNSGEIPENSGEIPENSIENPGDLSSIPSGTFRIPGIAQEIPGIPRELSTSGDSLSLLSLQTIASDLQKFDSVEHLSGIPGISGIPDALSLHSEELAEGTERRRSFRHHRSVSL